MLPKRHEGDVFFEKGAGSAGSRAATADADGGEPWGVDL